MSSLKPLIEQNANDALTRVDVKPLQGKSVLLTGATGMIGVNLEAALHLGGAAKVITPHRQLPQLGTFDYIIHAAGYAQPARFMADALGTISVNTTMLIELLGRLNPKGRLLFLSTSEVCSGNARGLHNESDIGTTNPSAARAPYIESKRCGEAICHAARSLGKQAIICRVASVYGPGVKPKDTRVVSQFIDRALTEREITLKDNGSARRVFLYVSDAVEMMLNILLHAEGPIYNVGGPALNNGNLNGEVTIITLARRIGEMMKVPVKAAFEGQGLSGAKRMMQINGGAVAGAPQHVGLDIGRYLREFGDKPFISLEEGLKRTIAWHREMIGVNGKVAA